MLISAQVRVEHDLFRASGATGKLSEWREKAGVDFGQGRMYAKRFFQLFSEPRIRRATVGSGVM